MKCKKTVVDERRNNSVDIDYEHTHADLLDDSSSESQVSIRQKIRNQEEEQEMLDIIQRKV